MIRYVTGNLLDAQVEALVNTVNEVGVMGKGVALMFREAFPENTRAYTEAAKAGGVRVGHMFVTANPSLLRPHWIINFPTKKHWRQPSRLKWVRAGLRDLVRVVHELETKSVALPPLGCGNGGLEWDQVRREIEGAASELTDVEVIVYEPTRQYHNSPKREGVESLTPARALIAELIRRYAVLGLECSNLEVRKLAWFLHRAISELGALDPMDLRFGANRYGPYADRLRHLLNGLDGSYLHCEKRLSDAGPYHPIWFENSKRLAIEDYLSGPEARQYKPALEKAASTIDGFESPYGMELLATVDWLLSERDVKPSVEELRIALAQWPGTGAAVRRKQRLFDDDMLRLALDRLVDPAHRQSLPNG
ncbi:MAG: macro domain-containing protein [Gemmatimonadota bacterium]|nr:macro domain-containing protein [Gemmatimonadota bacterium]